MTKEYEVVIDGGHGGKDPGAVSTEKEKDWTLKISLYQYKRFKELGVKVGMTRTTDKTLTENERVRLAQKGKYCLSNHLNAGGGDRGEVIHSIYDNGKLANRIATALKAAGQTAVKVYNRRGNSGDYYYMHRRTGSTITNIVEYCFIDNKTDFAHFKKNWEAYAEAVVKAFCEHIGKKYTAPGKKAEPAKKPAATKPAATKPAASGTMYRVITGSFKSKKNAEDRVAALKKAGFDSFLSFVNGFYRVVTGSFSDRKNAEARMAALKKKKYDSFLEAYKK